VGLRAFENVFYIAGVVALLAMLTVSQNDAIGTTGELRPPSGRALTVSSCGPSPFVAQPCKGSRRRPCACPG
jgi:hypothetical protein